MKTLYLTYRNGVVVDQENATVSELKSSRTAVGDVYLIEEDIHVITGNSNISKDIEHYTGEQFDAKVGDILISFYEQKFPHKFVLVHSDEWKENIETYNKITQEEAEKWAAKNANNKSDSLCDCDCEYESPCCNPA